ncbi:trypsin-like peptidase domain-containing protein [Pseudomonas xantholysinigenes]|uniref:Trypsin-like peptidase domain-containing protein n=1 Tax=Pseudomonas xantholysinigenes TaxID=2745490 RepID=A0A9E6PXB5_9PSED|nr:trypsin-like peptidase domain-containing protein [Pseudomonas xantholysinigenes]QXI38186.1 trypsin-like peptidase domain-containing protein [Pseudomonas xantholysinigenes]
MQKVLTLAFLGMTLPSFTALAASDETPPFAPPIVLHNSNGENAQWTGIGRLTWQNRRCIATLLDSRDEPSNSSGPAYVLTAGHCVGGINGKIITDQPIRGSVTFNYFVDTTEQRHIAPLKQVVWSSLQGADLALLELDTTLKHLLDQGITPRKLGPSPASGAQVQLIGEPSSIDQGLRLSTCVERFASISRVASWVWRNTRRNDCQGFDEGASGSPIFDAASQRLVSVVNSLHGTEIGAIPVGRVQGCFAKGQVDLDSSNCQLLPGFQLQPQGGTFKSVAKARTLADGSLEQARWGFSFLIDTPRYRYKVTQDALACEDPAGYSGTIPASEALINDPIGPAPGTYYLCLVGVQSEDQLPWPALMANSLSLAVELLPSAKPSPQVSTVRLDNGGIRVTWARDPEIVFYRVKRGDPATTDCADPSGYRLLPGYSRDIPASALPLKLCTVAIDLAKQSSPARSDLLQATAF